MRRAGCFLLQAADAAAVPAGHALAVDREIFSAARRLSSSREQPTHRPSVREESHHTRRDRPQCHHHPRVSGPLTSSPPARHRTATPHRRRPPRLLRQHLAHRRRHDHRHGQGLLRRALGQRHRRLHQPVPSPKTSTIAFIEALATAEKIEAKALGSSAIQH